MSTTTRTILFVATLLAAATAPSVAQPTHDLASLMPADTIVYIGWAPDAAQAPRLGGLAKLIFDGVHKLNPDDVENEAVTAILDLYAAAIAAPGGVGVFNLEFPPGRPRIDAAAVVNAGAKASDLALKLGALVRRAAADLKPESRTIDAVSFESITIPDGELPLAWGAHEGRFFVAVGDGGLQKVVARLTSKGQSLLDNDEFKLQRRKTDAGAHGPHFCVFADLASMMGRLKISAQTDGTPPALFEKIVKESGFGALRSTYLHTDVADGIPRTRWYTHVDGPFVGLLHLWQQKPLTDDDLRIVPKSAYWALVGNLDLVAAWRETLRVVDAIDSDAAMNLEGGLAASKQVLGFSITDDLLPAFGDTWTLYDAREHGGVLLMGSVLAAEVRDAKALGGMLERLVELAGVFSLESPVRVELREYAHGAHAIKYVLIGNVPAPVAPAWTFVGDRWVFGLFPQTVAAAARHIDPKTRGATLLDHADFKKLRALLPKDAQSLGYYDTRYLTELFYGFSLPFAALGASLGAGPNSLGVPELLPPLDEVTKDVLNCVSVTSVDKDGLLVSQIGHGEPLAAAAAGVALGSSIVLPSLARARELAKRTVSSSNLRALGMALHVHASEHEGSFPQTFDVLVQAGVLTPQQLASPRNPDPATPSYDYVAGQSTKADMRNVLAYERTFSPEGTNVLFVDGHVEWMRLDEFRAAVRATYKRLNRENELPAEFGE
ncbi:MAG: H-X9-DG-CTERM domain-containing protein [Phycisphaerae bacterium]